MKNPPSSLSAEVRLYLEGKFKEGKVQRCDCYGLYFTLPKKNGRFQATARALDNFYIFRGFKQSSQGSGERKGYISTLYRHEFSNSSVQVMLAQNNLEIIVFLTDDETKHQQKIREEIDSRKSN